MPTAQSGEQNGRACLTDGEVDLLIELAESEAHLIPRLRFWTHKRLAEKFEVSVSLVRKIVGGQRR